MGSELPRPISLDEVVKLLAHALVRIEVLEAERSQADERIEDLEDRLDAMHAASDRRPVAVSLQMQPAVGTPHRSG